MRTTSSRREVIINVAELISGTALSRFFSALTIIIIARQLGPEVFGQYAASLSLTRLVAVLFSLGLDGWLLRNGGLQRQRLGAMSIACLSIKAGLGIIWLVGVALVAPHLNQEVFPASLIYLSALSTWLDELVKTVWSTFKAALRNRATFWLMTLSQSSLLLVTLGLVALGVQEASGYLTSRVITSVVSSGMASVLMLRVFEVRIHRSDLRQALFGTLPFGASVALATIYGQADVTIVANWLGKQAAGFYSPAVSITTTLFLVPAAMYEVVLPVLSRSHRDGSTSIRHESLRFVAWAVLLGVILGGGLALIAPSLVRVIYGGDFGDSGDVLRVLSGVLAFKCVSFALAAILAAVGWQGRRVIVQVVSAFVNIALNLLIVQIWGIIGVAKVYVLSEAVLAMGYMVLVAYWQRKERLV